MVRSLVGAPPPPQWFLIPGVQLDAAAQENAGLSRWPMDFHDYGSAAACNTQRVCLRRTAH